MTLTGEQFTITAGDYAATVVEVGGGLRRLTLGDVDVTVPYADDTLPPKCCGGVLVPWPNRVRAGRYGFAGQERQLPLTEADKGNANHGLARWARWHATGHLDDRLTMAIDIVPQNGYPFEMRVEVTYALDVGTGLTVTTTASNTGVDAAPFGAGFHPYLSTRGAALDDTVVLLPASEHLLTDTAAIPVGREAVEGTPRDLRAGVRLGGLRLDDGFTGLSRQDGRCSAEVRSAAGGAMIWFDESFGFLQVFTLDDLAGAGPGVAIEPMTCAPDAFNSGDGLMVLEPGRAWTGAWGIVAT